jgi:hypothetical protein
LFYQLNYLTDKTNYLEVGVTVLVDSVGVTVFVDTVVSVTTVVVSVVGTVALSDSLEVQETANIDAITIAAKIIFFIFLRFYVYLNIYKFWVTKAYNGWYRSIISPVHEHLLGTLVLTLLYLITILIIIP